VIPTGQPVTLYKCGPFIDLCRGPHVTNTAVVGAFAVASNSSAVWTEASSAANSARASEVRSSHCFRHGHAAYRRRERVVCVLLTPQTVQRVYGVAFGAPSDLDSWKRNRELAARHDHRLLGTEQGIVVRSI